MSTLFGKKLNKKEVKGVSKNPFFWFGLTSFVLMGLLFFSSDSLAQANFIKNNDGAFNPFFNTHQTLTSDDLFFNQNNQLALETPDLEIIQDNSIYAVSTPSILTTQTLGDIFGGQTTQRTDVTNYTVQLGDTVDSVAKNFGISDDTVAWANNISVNANLQVGQILTILPVSGVVYTVQDGDTLSQIAKSYNANEDDIIAFNGLANDQDLFIGDTLIIPGGIIPPKAAPLQNIQVPLATDSLIPPAEGVITQGLHFENAIDLANKCGTPVYAAAAGIVQRAVGNGAWNLGKGNYITILHPSLGNIVTYYGHLMTLFVKSGDQVNVGDRIGLMGETGDATGCHVHYEVLGAQNNLAKYGLGAHVSY